MFNKIKIKNTLLLLQFQNPIEKLHKQPKFHTLNKHIHDRSLSWLGTGTSIKSGGVKIVL
jgi:hypothetical protein